MNHLSSPALLARRTLIGVVVPWMISGPASGETVRKAEAVPDAALLRSDSAESRRKARAALASAETAVRRDPHDPRAVTAKASALCQSGRSRAAVDYLMDLKAEYLDFFPHQLALADAFAAARMFGDAAIAYQVVVSEAGYGAGQRQAAKERLAAMQRDRRLIAGEHAVRTNNAAAARRALAELKTEADHPDVLALRVAVLAKEHRFDEARRLLNRIAAAGWNSRTMAEARMALADAEMGAAKWGPAAADYRAVENDPALSTAERSRAAQTSRDMMARVRPTVQQETTGRSQNEGTLWTSGIELSTGVFGDGRNIVFLRGIWDEIGLGHQKLITADDAERYQAELAWRRLTKNGFYGEVTAGGGDQGAVYGAAIGRYDQPGPGWELRFRGNERVTDSLLLMALGGTQDAITFNYRRRLGERWHVDARLGWRRVEVEGANLGDGINLDFRLVYTLLEERDGRPGVTAAYFAEFQDFNRRGLPDRLLHELTRAARREDDPADSLIDDRINRHGLVLTATKRLGARWTGFVYGGAAYEFDDGRAEGMAGAGLSAWLSPNATLIFGIDYATSGNAANAGEDVFTGSVRVRVSF